MSSSTIHRAFCFCPHRKVNWSTLQFKLHTLALNTYIPWYSYIISPYLLGLKLSLHFAEGGSNTATAAGHLVVVSVVLGGDGLDVLGTELSHPLHQRVLHLIVGFKPVHLVLEDTNLVYCLGNGPEKEMLLSWNMSTSIISFAKRQNKMSVSKCMLTSDTLALMWIYKITKSLTGT